jgi:hypothetical protein
MVDIPSVSIRNPLLPQIFAHPELVEKWYTRDENGDVDLRHVSTPLPSLHFAGMQSNVPRRTIRS